MKNFIWILCLSSLTLSESALANNELDFSDIECRHPTSKVKVDCLNSQGIVQCRIGTTYYSKSLKEFRYGSRNITYRDSYGIGPEEDEAYWIEETKAVADVVYGAITAIPRYLVILPTVNSIYKGRFLVRPVCDMEDETYKEAYRLKELGY